MNQIPAEESQPWLNQIPAEEFQPWQLNGAQSLKRKSFAPLGLGKWQDFTEYDLMY